MTKKILWMRRLSCGHERLTTVAYLMKVYDKPVIGNPCYCRVCNKNVKIVDVYEIKVKEDKEIQYSGREERVKWN